LAALPVAFAPFQVDVPTFLAAPYVLAKSPAFHSEPRNKTQEKRRPQKRDVQANNVTYVTHIPWRLPIARSDDPSTTANHPVPPSTGEAWSPAALIVAAEAGHHKCHRCKMEQNAIDTFHGADQVVAL
jgi:hypothetical protein